MQVVTKIDTVCIPLIDGVRTYYIPYKHQRYGKFYISISPICETPDNVSYLIGENDGGTGQYQAQITLAGTDGKMIVQDFELELCAERYYTQSPLLITQSIDWDNSYITIPEAVTIPSGSGMAFFLNFVYVDSYVDKYPANKSLIVKFPGDGIEHRLSDFIVGYQGKLLRIEVLQDNGAQAESDGYLTLNDTTGRTFNKLPLWLFTQYDRGGSGYRIPRFYNPLRFEPLIPIWQNSKIFSTVATTLNFIFSE